MDPFQIFDQMAGPLMYKNKLQEHAQKSGLQIPVYQNFNEGFAHAPKFRSTVMVNNAKYTSQRTFPDCRTAEQEAAKLAYESISKYTKKADCSSFVYENPILCKSILHEYAIKMNIGLPKYHTALTEGPRPVFISKFCFGGKTYTGEIAQSKKVAEQLVARAAIRSLLGSDCGTLARIIKSKEKLYAPLHGKNDSGNVAFSTSPVHPEDQQQKNDSVQIAGLPSQRKKASDQTEIVTYGRTTQARNVAKRKIEMNNWEQSKRCVSKFSN